LAYTTYTTIKKAKGSKGKDIERPLFLNRGKSKEESESKLLEPLVISPSLALYLGTFRSNLVGPSN